MTPEQIAVLRPQLAEFAAGMLGCLAHSDQRAKGELYLRGLMIDGRRKSMQPMAERLGIDHQQLQQFISSSTWDFTAVRRNLAAWAGQVIDPIAYVDDDTGFPKDGQASACVARQYSGTLGKAGNCQIGVSVHQVSDTASVAGNWRLYCPKSWDEHFADDPLAAQQVRDRRAKAGLGDDVAHREKWRLALDMLAEQIRRVGTAEAAGGRQCRLRRCDTVSERAGRTRTGLRGRRQGRHQRLPRPRQLFTAPIRAVAARPKPRYRQAPVSLRELALAAGRGGFAQVCWRQGTRKTAGNPTADMASRFALVQVRPANRNNPRNADGSLPLKLALVEWPEHAQEPTDYWLTNLPTDTPIEQVVDLAKIRWRIEHDYRELKTGLGLDHFEGRTWTGWNRHVTLVALAQAFITMLRLDPKAPAPA